MWYRSAVKAKTQTINQIRALLVSAPQAIRDAAYRADAAKYVVACTALSQCAVSAALASLHKALRLLAKRWTSFNEELREIDAELARLTQESRATAAWPLWCRSANGLHIAGDGG